MANIIYPDDYSQARSPMYLQCEADTNGETITDAVHSLSIYSGDKTTGVPASAQVQISKLSVDGKVLTSISEIVRAYFVQNFTSHNAPGSGTYYINQAVGAALWVKVATSTTESDGGYNENDTFLAFDGYTEFADGVNAVHAETILTTPRTIKLLEGQYFNLPVKNSPQIEWAMGQPGDFTTYQTVNANGDDTDKMVVYLPAGEPNITSVGDIALDAVIATDRYYIFVRNASTNADLGNIEFEIICEPKYEGHYIAFINKWGVWDTMVFEKKSTESMEVNAESYRRMIGAWGARSGEDGTRPYSYDVNTGTHARINAMGQESITLNTGWLDDDYNEVMKQLLQSELFLMDNEIPVVLDTYSIDYKQEVNEMVQYTVTFKYAYGAINRVQ
jgi:hypothetical protein